MSQNPFGRPAQEQAIYETHFYPGEDEKGRRVLVNKADIRDFDELMILERQVTADRAELGFPPEANPNSYDGLKAIHGHLFQDLYDWAGKERPYTTGRNAAPFARPEFIKSFMDSEFAKFNDENQLKGLSSDAFADRASHYVNEINAAHPFIDGNGRTQRHWLRMAAEQAGHRITLRSEDQARYYEASRIGFESGINSPMRDLIRERIEPARTKPRVIDPKPTDDRER